MHDAMIPFQMLEAGTTTSALEREGCSAEGTERGREQQQQQQQQQSTAAQASGARITGVADGEARQEQRSYI